MEASNNKYHRQTSNNNYTPSISWKSAILIFLGQISGGMKRL
jgi:hypothetical protein